MPTEWTLQVGGRCLSVNQAAALSFPRAGSHLATNARDSGGSHLEEQKEEIVALRRTVAKLEATNADLVKSATELVARHDALEQPGSDPEVPTLRQEAVTLHNKLADLESEAAVLREKLVARDAENTSLQDKMADLESEAVVLRDKLAARDTENASLQDKLAAQPDATWAAQTASLKRDVQRERDAYVALRDEFEKEKASMHQDLERQMTSLTGQLEHERKECQRYYELWASLRGTMRGVVRVRPLDNKPGMAAGWTIDMYGQSLSIPQAASAGDGKISYTFDRVFGPATSGGQLFSEIAPLVGAALHGEQVLIFAYGASGTGKSFSVTQILQASIDMVFQADTSINVSYLSIYLDNVYDLIAPKVGHILKFPQPLRTLIPENATVETTDASGFWKVFQRGEKRRKKAATNLNTQSSRDHGVLTLLRSEGSLTVCDLAGTENVRESGVAGDTFQEALSINKSLTALRDVISSVRASTKPTFTSPLTQLLRPALGGGNLKTVKVLMLGTVDSERLASSRETLKWVGEACGKTSKKGPVKPNR